MSAVRDGILNVCKPVGMPSFKCMSIVKRRLGLGKVGFFGTLDPAACGVLVLLCGRATKLQDYLHGRVPHPGGKTDGETIDTSKVYRSVFTFGIETDTLDSTGIVTGRSEVLPTEEEFTRVLGGLVGEIEIEVPKFSAVHIDGRRAYDLARSGVDFTPPKKIVQIKRFELLKQLADNKFFVEIECETGTYVRSLAKLVAQRLKSLAIASSILRVRAGDFDIKDAKCLQKISIDDIMPIDYGKGG